ncbi:hypothetical protein RMATCC62417_09697 [Rhizopus microsporus]|nr:hypothetical protein RMATCC62417_09697 [Rhizopus microsporus]
MKITPASSSPDTTAHCTVPSNDILPGGRLQRFSQQWRQHILHQWSTSVVADGYQLQWNKTPRPWRYAPMKFTKVEQAAVDEAATKFMNLGIIEIFLSQPRDYLSKLFTIQDPISDAQFWIAPI